MNSACVIPGLALLVLLNAVVDAQVCSDESCTLSVENQQRGLDYYISVSALTYSGCQSQATSIRTYIAGCRNTWTTNNCQENDTSAMDQRLQNVINYLETACNALIITTPKPPVVTTCNTSAAAVILQAISSCQPTSLGKLAVSNTLTRSNICRSVQQAIDCITNTSALCTDKTQIVANFAVLDEIYLGHWFDCQLTVNGIPVANNITTTCSYPAFAKCYNPLLTALGKQTIDDNFDYYYIRDGLNVFDIFKYDNRNDYCDKVKNLDWTSLMSCIESTSADCDAALGAPSAIPLNDLDSVWDELFYSFSINLKYLELIRKMCTSGCNNIAARSIQQSACPSPLSPANNVLASAFKTDITALCRTLNTSISCINSAVSGCSLLQEDVSYNTLYASDRLPIQLAAYLCGIHLEAELPWEQCRSKEALDNAANIETQCVSNGLMLKNSMRNGVPSVSYVMLSMKNMFACYQQWPCWQNEATYITPLYPFTSIMQTVYSSSIVPTLSGISVVQLKGKECDILSYMKCLSPLLDAVGAQFNSSYLGQLYSVSSLLSGSASEVQSLCSKLVGVNWDSMIACTEGNWSTTCSSPVINLRGMDTASTLSRGLGKFYLTDLRAMKTWVSSICMPNCSGKTFGINYQQIVQCITYDDSLSRISDESRLTVLSSLLGQPIESHCKNLSTLASCLQAVSGGCTYLERVINQMTEGTYYTLAYSICFPSSPTTQATTTASNDNYDSTTEAATSKSDYSIASRTLGFGSGDGVSTTIGNTERDTTVASATSSTTAETNTFSETTKQSTVNTNVETTTNPPTVKPTTTTVTTTTKTTTVIPKTTVKPMPTTTKKKKGGKKKGGKKKGGKKKPVKKAKH